MSDPEAIPDPRIEFPLPKEESLAKGLADAEAGRVMSFNQVIEAVRNAREAERTALIHLCQRLLEGWSEDIKDLGGIPSCVTEWSECDTELSRIVGEK